MVQPHHMLRRLLPLCLLVALFLTACEESGGVEVEASEADPNLPPARVELPEPPPASGFEIPEKNADGTLRVEGLIHHRDKHMDQPVEVRGVIVGMSPECDPASAKRKGEECPEPNLFIRDEQDAQATLRVVGYDKDFLKRADLEVGQEHVFKGQYQKVAQGFVATEDGLILVDSVDDMAVLEQ